MYTDEQKFEKAYNLINSKASTNSPVLAASGIAGFPATLTADAIVIFTHYEPMINEIRAIYGRKRIDKTTAKPMIRSIFKEILLDITADKALGQIPVAGIYFNAICAKALTWRLGMLFTALTWRLGMLFTILSSRGEEINYKNMSDVVTIIRKISPQSDMFQFTKPEHERFRKIALSVGENDFETFDAKIERAMEAFD